MELYLHFLIYLHCAVLNSSSGTTLSSTLMKWKIKKSDNLRTRDLTTGLTDGVSAYSLRGGNWIFKVTNGSAYSSTGNNCFVSTTIQTQLVYRRATSWMPGVRFPAGARVFVYTVLTGSGVHQVCIQWVSGALPRAVEWPWREADNTPASSAEVKDDGAVFELHQAFSGLGH
jgi:hypothetical protein